MKEPPSYIMPHGAVCIAQHNYAEDKKLKNDVNTHAIAAMDLLNLFIYPALVKGYGKFATIIMVKKISGEFISFSLEGAIPLTTLDGILLPKNEVYARLYEYIKRKCELYEADFPIQIIIKGYSVDPMVKPRYNLSIEKRSKRILEILALGLCEFDPIKAKEIRHTNKVYSHITTSKEKLKSTNPFIVADLETILIEKIHTPYAAGLMVVRPGSGPYAVTIAL